ncbi:MAG: aminotransferase class I/II-fold pyridoxal phosphate-dependent enzyme, partial [Anaerolineales bacterium]
NELQLGYTESQGNPLLRKEISQLYNCISADQILVAAPEEAILLAMQALLQPGDHVISIFPAYQSLYEIAQRLGCSLSFWRFRETNSNWTLDFSELEKLLRPQTRLLIVNFPHNPTGYQPSENEFLSIIKFAQQHHLFLFCDEMYRFLEYPPKQPLPSAVDIYPQAVSLSGLSKSFALPGLRVGWLATQSSEVIERCAMLKDYTTICSSAPSEILAIIALRNRATILERNQQIISTNLTLAQNFFNRYAPFATWIPPQAGSVALAQWRVETPHSNIYQQLLDEKGLMILPGSVFELDDRYFRLGLGRKTFSIALGQLEEWIKTKYNGVC